MKKWDKRYRVVTTHSVLGYFDSVNKAAKFRDSVTVDGVPGIARVESWGLAPYWDGDWTLMNPQPKHDPRKRS